MQILLMFFVPFAIAVQINCLFLFIHCHKGPLCAFLHHMVETVGHSVCKTADKGILLGHGRQQLFCVFIFRNKFGHFCRKFICKAHYNKEFPLYLRERIDHSC